MKAAYIIPFSNVDKYREFNIRTLIKYLNNLTDVDIYIAEQLDGNERIQIDSAHHIILPNNEVFSRGRVFNYMFNLLKDKYDIFIFGDADVLINYNIITNILKSYNNHSISSESAVTPYIKNIQYLDEQQTSEFSKSFDFSMNTKINPSPPYEPFGGLFIIHKNAFSKLKGFDEIFSGWGAEDSAMRYAAQYLNVNIVKYDYKAHHMWHPVYSNSKYMKMREVNRKIFKEIYLNKEKFILHHNKRNSI